MRSAEDITRYLTDRYAVVADFKPIAELAVSPTNPAYLSCNWIKRGGECAVQVCI